MQRLRAINHFIDDLYHEQRVVADGVFPADLLDDSVNYRPECRGASPKFGVWAHISGSDLVRDADGTMYVLEDNLRVPVRRQLRAGEPGDLQAGVRRPVRRAEHPARRRVHRRARPDARLARAPTTSSGRRSPCSPRASTTAPTSSTPSSPSASAPTWSRAPTSWSATTTASTCARSTGASGCDVIYRRVDDTVPRPRGVPPRQHARRARPDARVAGRQRGHRQRARRRRGRRQGRVRLGAGPDPLLPRRGAAARRTCRRTAACYADERRVRARQHRRARRQAGQRERRLRPAHRRPGDARASWTAACGADRGRSAQLGRPADPHAVAPRRRCATARSSRATSTCGRSSSAASASTSPPAGSPASRCARARWSSTRRRAAAARTPGSSRT